MVGANPAVALAVQDSMEHFHSWLLFQPTKMPFVDLSQLLSPQIPPLFQDAGISPVWVRQEFKEGSLQASFSPSSLPNSSQLW